MTPRSARAGAVSTSGTPSGNANIASMTFNAASNSQSVNRTNAIELRTMALVAASQSIPLTISSSSDASAAASRTRMSLAFNDMTRPAVAIASDLTSLVRAIRSQNSP